MKIVIPITKRALNVSDVSISAEQIKHILEKEVKSHTEHFNSEDGGWGLDKSFIVSDILYKILGSHIEDEINQAFINSGFTVSYNDGKSFIEHKEGYKPIFFNEFTGEIVVIDNSDDKSYLFKYKSKNGWYHIGKL